MRRGRHKGAMPVDPMADYKPYGPGHPVYRTINLGDRWLTAWEQQYPRPRRIAIEGERWEAIRYGAPVTRTEIATMATHWRVPVEDVIASLPAGSLAEDG